jgi:peptidoglycan-associated lipoprotein
MNNFARISATLLITLFFFTGCTRKQGPTQLGNATGSGSSLSDTGFGGDLIPAGSGDENWGLEGGLQARGAGDGIGNGMFGEFTMVEGVLPSVYFGFDSSSVSAAERGKLQQAASYLQENSGTHLLVEGHCDWYGTSEYNLALGDRRANSISDYLGTLGISPMRIEKLSKGSLEATSGLSKSQSSQDRRADLILLQR